MELMYPIIVGCVYFAIFFVLNKLYRVPFRFGLIALIVVILLFALMMVVLGLAEDTGWLNMGFVVVMLLVGYVAATYSALWVIYSKLTHKQV